MTITKQRCINGSYIHKMEAFVDKDMNVTEKCSLCNTVYFHKIDKDKWHPESYGSANEKNKE